MQFYRIRQRHFIIFQSKMFFHLVKPFFPTPPLERIATTTQISSQLTAKVQDLNLSVSTGNHHHTGKQKISFWKYLLECFQHPFQKSLYKRESVTITDLTCLACGGSKLPKMPILDSGSFYQRCFLGVSRTLNRWYSSL